MRCLINILIIAILSLQCLAQGKAASTNTPPGQVKQMERKAEHLANKIVVKSRPKGSKKESDWQTEREYPLMFNNNRKVKKEKTK